MKKTIKDFLLRIGYSSRPDFMIIGAQKAGTSALYTILNKHSSIHGSTKKEIHYFDNDDWYAKEDFSSYHSFFPLPHQIAKGVALFEATPMYLFHPEVAKRLYDYRSDLKLIISLRNPAERAFSAWTMFHHHFDTAQDRQRHDPRSFSEAISQELSNIDDSSFYQDKRAYVKRGIYHTQIKAYLDYFPSQQMLIIEANEIKNRFEDTTKKIQSFIGVPHEKLKLVESNQSKVTIKEDYKEDILKLQEFYRPHNLKLFDLIDKEFHWNVEKQVMSD